MKPALVVIDMQECFVASGGVSSGGVSSGGVSSGGVLHPDLGEAIEIINYVAEQFRSAGRAVIWVQDCESIDETDPAFEVIAALAVHDDDVRISKVASNAFREPALAAALESCGADFALFCGYRAESCVLATVRGAADREFPHAVLRGAVLSPAADAAQFVERISPLLSYEVAAALVTE